MRGIRVTDKRTCRVIVRLCVLGCFTAIASTAFALEPTQSIRFRQASPATEPLLLYRLTALVSYPATKAPASWTPARVFEPVCQAPCATSLSPGVYRLGLGTTDSSRVLEVDGTLQLTGSETLLGSIESRSAVRFAGVALIGAGIVAIAIAAGIGISSATRDQKLELGQPPPDNGPGLGFGILIGTGVVAGVLGVVFAAQPDSAAIRVQR
jgi:hypothetical protein